MHRTLSALAAIALALVLLPAAAGRQLAGAQLVGGGRPWEEKQAQNFKPLIGILAQVGAGGTGSSWAASWRRHHCPRRFAGAAGVVAAQARSSRSRTTHVACM